MKAKMKKLLTFSLVNQSSDTAPKKEAVFEFLGYPHHFRIYPLFFVRYEVKRWIPGPDIIDDFLPHLRPRIYDARVEGF